MVVDFHVHVWEPRFIPAPVRRSWAVNAALHSDPPRDPDELLPRVTVGVSDPGGRNLLAALERNGIDLGLVLAVDYAVVAGEEAETPVHEVMQEYAAIVTSSEGRLEFAGSVDPRRPDALERATEALDVLGAKGLKFYPPSGFDPGDSLCDPLYRLLVERDSVAIFHTAITPGPFDNRFCQPINISRVQQRFPELRIVLAHAGWPAWWEEAVAVAAAHPRTYLELSLWQAPAARDWASAAHRIVDAVERVGADRVLFASDSMFGSRPDREIESVGRWLSQISGLAAEGRLAVEQVDLILDGNARRLLGAAADER